VLSIGVLPRSAGSLFVPLVVALVATFGASVALGMSAAAYVVCALAGRRLRRVTRAAESTRQPGDPRSS
jgi:hypothetical protein